MHSIDNKHNEIDLSACKYKKQNRELTGKTTTSSTWLDHLKTNCQVEHKTIKATKSDQYAVLGKITGSKKEPQLDKQETINVWELERT